jgi:hypothetical protein
MLLINSLIGAGLLIAFLGFIAVWLGMKAVPLIVIMVLVVGLLLHDIRLELRAANNKK